MKQKQRRKRFKQNNALDFHTLEERNLLAGINLVPSTGELYIAGDESSNSGSFKQVGSNYQATLSGFGTKTFSLTEVNKVIFIGGGGDDGFNNATGVESLLLGNDGNDVLNGGSGADVINGGNGNDTLNGREGNDRMYGNNGNDTMNGGDGNDRMFGAEGVNEVNGNDGNDLMFGGSGVDTMRGGNGADQLYPQGGDDIISLGDGGTPGATDIQLADLVIGGAGNDTMVGGGGLNVFYGSDGNDIFIGGNGENRMHGQNGDDELNSGSGNDYLAGQVGNDTINAGGGNDYILPGFGDDIVNAGAGVDYVVFSAEFSRYQITTDGSGLTVNDTRNVDGLDDVNLVERFRFSNGDRNAETGATKQVRIQPIVVANSNGTNKAEFLGNAAEEVTIKRKVDEIYSAAGIDVLWLAPRNYNNSFANVGNGSSRPANDLFTVIDAGDAANVGNSNAQIIDMYFVEIAAGFSDTGEDVSNGLAVLDGNGITIHIGDNLVGFEGGQSAVARVVAHEVAHNLGLDHVTAASNLMGQGSTLNSSQIATIRGSQLARDI